MGRETKYKKIVRAIFYRVWRAYVLRVLSFTNVKMQIKTVISVTRCREATKLDQTAYREAAAADSELSHPWLA
jgi:hypothetical protein